MATLAWSTVWKGTWSSATAYTIGSFVIYSGSSYTALTNNTNKQPDTNPSDWALVASGANNTDSMVEGSTNKYFTEPRVLATVLAGLSTATNAVISASDTVLGAFGKLQAQINGYLSATITFTNKTINFANNTVTTTLAQLNTAVSDADIASLAGTETLTNKRIQPRTSSTTTTATLTPDVSSASVYYVTAQNASITIANPTGTPVTGEIITIYLTDNGTARAISFGANYQATGQALPTTTTVSKKMNIIAQYDGTNWITSYTNQP